MIKILPKVLTLLQNVKFAVDLFIPVIEKVLNKDINGDGVVGK